MQLYLYADDESAELLAAARPKALLLGGDFAFGNFGDVLQHVGTVRRVRAATGLAVVSLINVMSRHIDVASIREKYDVDALALVSEAPIDAKLAADLGLRMVRSLCNVSYVQLYGGGFLNEMWGDFVLGIAEYILDRLPGVPYVISGQQVSQGFARQTGSHVHRFGPLLVGARDHESLGHLADQGVRTEFSFDDAVEPLISLRSKWDLRQGDGVFIHMNTSGYTGNDAAIAEMVEQLQLVATRAGGSGTPTLFQAFQDAREDVVDSIETIKRLEVAFPFKNCETILLVNSLLGIGDDSTRVLTGRFGYSSSYHVTLWLQLSGIPCWLRGSNAYYEQKRKALGIEDDLEAFLEQMTLPDHAENLQLRHEWLQKLDQVMGSIKPVTNRIEWDLPDADQPVRLFNFKGEPRFEQQLREAWCAQESSQNEVDRLSTELEDTLGSETHVLRARLEESTVEQERILSRLEAVMETKAGLMLELRDANAKAESLEREHAEYRQHAEGQDALLAEYRSRLQAYSEQLTIVGNDAHHYRDLYIQAHARRQDVSIRAIMRRHSQRWARLFRAIRRYFRTGRFDSAGQVGFYGGLQIIGHKLPIPQSLRSSLGRTLARYRRR